MIERKNAIEDLNKNISFISREFLNKNPEIRDQLEEKGAFENYMCTEGEAVTLLKETHDLERELISMVKIYERELEELRTNTNLTNPARVIQFYSIQGKIDAIQYILNKYMHFKRETTGVILRKDYAAFTDRLIDVTCFCAHCDPNAEGGKNAVIDTKHSVEDFNSPDFQNTHNICPNCHREIDYKNVKIKNNYLR